MLVNAKQMWMVLNILKNVMLNCVFMVQELMPTNLTRKCQGLCAIMFAVILCFHCVNYRANDGMSIILTEYLRIVMEIISACYADQQISFPPTQPTLTEF